MKHPDSKVQAKRDDVAYVCYTEKVKHLGNTLKTSFLEISFKYDAPSKVWLTEDPASITRLRQMFDFAYTDYLDNWRGFLGIQDLIVLGYDCDDWFGFTID
jgi:hypothetical protein